MLIRRPNGAPWLFKAGNGRIVKVQKQTHYSASPSNGPERFAKDLGWQQVEMANLQKQSH